MELLAYGELTIADINDGVSVVSVDVWYIQTSSPTEAPNKNDTNWKTEAPDWINGKYIWSKTVTTFDNGDIKESNPVCITGEKGSAGANGSGITNIAEQYYLSTSKEELIGDSWGYDPPTWQHGRYIWTRSEITWSNPTKITYTAELCDNTWEAANAYKQEQDARIQEITNTVEGVSSKVDAVENQITNKIWQDDITTTVDEYDNTIAEKIRTRVSKTEQDIGSITQEISDTVSHINTVDNKLDNLQTKELGWKVNYSAFDTPANGQLYLHGYNAETGSAEDIDGWVLWNGTTITIPKARIYPGAVCPTKTPIYVVRRTSGTATTYLVWADTTDGKWKSTSLIASSVSEWTWVHATDIVLGSFYHNGNGQAITSAQLHVAALTCDSVITSVETKSLITTTANAISSSVSQTYATKTELATTDAKASNAQADVSTLSTRVTQTENSITSQASSISSLGAQISTVEQTASGLTVSLQTTNNNVTAAQNTANTALSRGVEYIEGTQTAPTNVWTGKTTDSSLVKGKTIAYKLPYAGNSSSATLNLTLAGGGTTGAKGIRRLDSAVTTNYVANSVIHMTYDGTYWRITDYNSDTYDRVRYNKAIKCGTTAIVKANIIVGSSGVYKHLKAGTAFDVSYPILYAAEAIAASATGTNNYLCYSFTVTTTQSITLTAYKPVYIKGTLSGTTFTPVSTAPLTQTVPTSNDGYYYILLGHAITSTTMYLTLEHPIYTYFNDSFKAVSQIAVEAAKTATNYLNFGSAGLIVGDMTESTLGKNVLIGKDSVNIRNNDTILASFEANAIKLGIGNPNAEIDLCNGAGTISTKNYGGRTGEISFAGDRVNLVGKQDVYMRSSTTYKGHSDEASSSVSAESWYEDAYGSYGSSTGMQAFYRGKEYTYGGVLTTSTNKRAIIQTDANKTRATSSMYATDIDLGISYYLQLQSDQGLLLTSDNNTQASQPGIYWKMVSDKTPYIGYASDQRDGTFVWSITGTNYASGLAIGGGSGNLLYKGNVVLHADNYTTYAAPKSHASTATTYGIGTNANYGHVKLSDSTSTTSGTSAGIAATPTAVKATYDLANTANTNAAAAQAKADSAYALAETKANSGHTHDKITSGLSAFVAMYYDNATNKNHWFKPDVNYPTSQEINLGSAGTRTWDNIYAGKEVYINGAGVKSTLDTLNTRTTDSGWKNLSPSTGTWTVLRYRKIGGKVTIQGHASAVTWTGSSGMALATIPSGYRPSGAQVYALGNIGGKRLAKVGVTTGGNLFLDYMCNISDGSNYTTSTWLNFTIEYYV